MILQVFFSFLCFYLEFLQVLGGNGRYFVTESCGQVVGPDFGTYLEFDRDSSYKNGEVSIPDSVKGQEFECIIVIRGMPSTTEKRYISLYWRSFHIKEKELTTIENDVDACGKAYVTIYKGVDTTAPEKFTLCGASALPSHYEWEGEYATLYFYIDFRNPNLKLTTTGATTTANAATTPGSPNATTEKQQPTTTAVDNFPYPEAYMRLDITSYDYECNDSIPGVVMRCNESKRCLDDSLRCDFWFSRNCQSEVFPRDNTDTSKFPPGSCYRKTTPPTTTTTAAPPPPPPNFVPLYAAAGTLLFLLSIFWCCWKPGYLIWRLGRLRNVPCCQAFGSCLPCHGACSHGCTRCGSEEYGTSPTGGAAWRAAKLHEAAMNAQRDSIGSETPPINGGTGYPFYVNGNSYGRAGTYGGQPQEKLNPNGAPRASTVTGAFETPKKSLKSKLLPCLSDSTVPATKGGPMKNSVVPLQDGYGSAYPKTGPGLNAHPGGKGSNHGLDPDDPASLDAVRLANGWLKFLTGDGGHLREHR